MNRRKLVENCKTFFDDILHREVYINVTSLNTKFISSSHLNERNSVQCNDWNIIHRIGSRESLTQSTPVTCYITVMLQRESP